MAKEFSSGHPIELYEHRDKERRNNPSVGLVTPDIAPDTGRPQTYAYNPHLELQLQWGDPAGALFETARTLAEFPAALPPKLIPS